MQCYLTLQFYPLPLFLPTNQGKTESLCHRCHPLDRFHPLGVHDNEVWIYRDLLCFLFFSFYFAVIQTQIGTNGLSCTLRKGSQKSKLSIFWASCKIVIIKTYPYEICFLLLYLGILCCSFWGVSCKDSLVHHVISCHTYHKYLANRIFVLQEIKRKRTICVR